MQNRYFSLSRSPRADSLLHFRVQLRNTLRCQLCRNGTTISKYAKIVHRDCLRSRARTVPCRDELRNMPGEQLCIWLRINSAQQLLSSCRCVEHSVSSTSKSVHDMLATASEKLPRVWSRDWKRSRMQNQPRLSSEIESRTQSRELTDKISCLENCDSYKWQRSKIELRKKIK